MKKYLPVLAILAFAAPSAAFASFDASLSYGSSGTDVQQLQEFLISQKCLTVQATGYFGSLTLAAVKCFQSKYDIPSTGYFGSMSRAEANAVLINQPESESTVQSMCPAGWTCAAPAQLIESPADLSQGASAVAPLSSLVGVGSSSVNTLQSASATVPLSPLVGTGSTSVNPSEESTSTTSSLSPLIGSGRVVSQP